MSEGKRFKIRKILEAIPDDSWIKASDVEERTGICAHSVGLLVKYYLASKFVERRKKIIRGEGEFYEYRRFRMIGV